MLNNQIFNRTLSMLDPATLIKIISVSASGALSPGPLTTSSVTLGAKSGWRAGLGMSIGHTIIELPLVLMISYGLGTFFKGFFVKTIFGLIGGFFLLFFAGLTLNGVIHFKKIDVPENMPKYSSSITVGIALTLFNPYFIAWWIGVGSPLLMEALSVINIVNVMIFYLAHVWLDYSWLMFTSTIGSVSKINLKFYKIILSVLAIFLLYFGFEMIIDTLRNIISY